MASSTPVQTLVPLVEVHASFEPWGLTILRLSAYWISDALNLTHKISGISSCVSIAQELSKMDLPPDDAAVKSLMLSRTLRLPL